MAKISEVVKLKSGYANFVKLKSDFDEVRENAGRMAMYRPTKSHRTAFERLSRGLYQPNDKKFYLLSGSYGTGKSHLCLMFANFLSRASGDPEIRGFYENYEKLDPDTAKMLRNVRKDGQYLVAICEYYSGKRFEDAVLKAVLDACRAMGLDAGIQTEYDEAERCLADWDAKSDDETVIRNFYGDFTKALEKVKPGLPVKQLRAKLKEYDSEILGIFRAAFREMMGGIEFQAQSGNLIPIIKELVRSKPFKERFKGLAVFFDEFGFTLEKAAYSKDTLQGYMETICKDEPNVLFVGCIHKDFKAYADRLSQEDASVMSARITPVDLLNEGIEEIIGAIVETDKNSETWQKEVQPKVGVFDQLVPPCIPLKLFPWIDDVQRIRQRVLEDIYGVHPMALACLLRLSSEVGSDARSTFTFFSGGDVGGEAGSYADFIEKADLTAASGKLNLYTVDRLFEFFSRELSLKNPELRDRQRQLVNGFYASLETMRKSESGDMFGDLAKEREAILRTILLYQMCQVPTTLENIQFGLYCLTNVEKNLVDKHLKHLSKSGAVFLRKQSKTYELSIGGGDVYELIERYLNETSLHPSDMIEAFLAEAGKPTELEFLEAKQYNLHFNEDKRFKCYFKEAKDLGSKFWEEVNSDWEENLSKEKKSYEGTVVYVLCEDDGAIQIAKKAVQDIPGHNIAVAVPLSPQPFADTLLRVKACKHYLPPGEAEKISAQTEARLRDILEDPEDGYLPVLRRILRNITSGDSACWYGLNGKVVVDRPKQFHKPADVLCEELYKNRCRIKHPDLNFIHDNKWQTAKNNALKQAIGILLDADRVMIDNGNPENHGQRRYLEKALLKGAGALKKTGSDGAVSYFECENQPDKISDDFPVLKELCRRMAELNSGKTLSLGSFLEDAKKPPYGAGGTMLVLALAHVMRAYGERLRIYKDSTKTIETYLDTYDALATVVGDPATQIVFEVKDISVAQAKLLEGIANALNAAPLKYGERRSLTSVYDLMKKWWNELPSAAKIIDLYEKDEHDCLKKLKETLDLAGGMDRFDILLETMPSLYTNESVGERLTESEAEEICEKFAKDIKSLESGLLRVRTAIAGAISEIFGSEGDMIQCEKTVNKWYKNLNPNQRDPLKCGDDDAQYFLTRLADKPLTFESIIMKSLAQYYGFGPVSEWSSLHIQDYVAKLRHAKKFIDEAKPVVPYPSIKSKVWEIREGGELYVDMPEGASEIIFTSTGEDPRKAEKINRVNERFNLVEILGDRPSISVSMRALDADGNVSDLVTVKLINKAKEYEIQTEKDLLGFEAATFKFPEDIEGIISVIKSLLQHGIKKGFLDRDKAEKIDSSVTDLLRK